MSNMTQKDMSILGTSRPPSPPRPVSQRSAFSFGRRSRPAPLAVASTYTVRSQQDAVQISRTSSKGGIRDLFTRSKSRSKSQAQAQTQVCANGRMTVKARSASGTNATVTQNSRTPQLLERPGPMEAINQSSEPTERPRLAMRTKSSRSTATSIETLKSSQKSTLRHTSTVPRRLDAVWDPPPLFQAYPQAIRHATLSAPTLSADTILRISSQKAQNHAASETLPEQQAAHGINKLERVRSKHRRAASGSMTKAEWTHKTFVLVTSGYMLQYTGDGSFDRLPEKMMRLGKDSVVFVSDVIPGKHWVLQISQSLNADGVPVSAPQSLFSRLTFRGADYRRSTTTMLLVLNSADELESWMCTLRREIEALGGRKHVSETGRPKIENETILQMNALPSPRFNVQREHERFSNPSTPLDSAFQNENRDSAVPAETIASSGFSRKSTGLELQIGRADTSSIGTSLTSRDEALESLRESHRSSFVSTDQRTILTSRCSSAATSPIIGDFGSPEKSQSKDHSGQATMSRPNAAAIAARRQSMQQMQVHDADFDVYAQMKQLRSRPHSTYGRLGRIAQVVNMPEMPRPSAGNDLAESTSTSPAPPDKFARLSDQALNKGLPQPPKTQKTQELATIHSVHSITSSAQQPEVYIPGAISFAKVPKARASMINIVSHSNSNKSNTPLGRVGENDSSVRRPPGIDHKSSTTPKKYASARLLNVDYGRNDIVSHEVSLPSPPILGLSPGQPSPYSPPPRTPLESFIPTPPSSTASMANYQDSFNNLSSHSLCASKDDRIHERRPVTNRAPKSYPQPQPVHRHNDNLPSSGTIDSPPLTTRISLYSPNYNTAARSGPRPAQRREHISSQLSPTSPAFRDSMITSRPSTIINNQRASQTPAQIALPLTPGRQKHLMLPNLKRLKESAGPKNLMNRRSLPSHKLNGSKEASLGPPLPPPMCALPPVPPPTGALPAIPST